MKNTNTKVILFGIILTLFVSNIIQARANYTNVDLIDFVDNDRESFYTEIYNKNNLSISLAYNNDSNLLFFNYTTQIQQLQIDNILVNSSCESKSYKVIFSQVALGNITYYQIEIWLDRTNYISLDDEYYIRINQEAIFRLLVNPILPEPEPEPEGPGFEKWGWMIALIAVFFAIILFRLIMLFRKPYMYFRINNEYNCEPVGRYCDSIFDDNIRKWHYYFKTNSGIREIYSNLSFNDLENFALNIKNFIIGSLSGFHQLFPHIIIKKIQVPYNVTIKKTQLDPSLKFQKFMYEFLSFLPMKSLVYNLYKQIYKETDEKVTEIEYLELEYSQESLEFKFNASYKVSELNKEGIPTWIEKEESNIDYSKILALEKSDIKELKFGFNKAEVHKFNSIREALQNRDSNDQLKSKYIVKELELSSQNRKLSDENFDFYQQLRDMKDNFSSKLVEALKRFAQKSESLNSALPEVLGEVFYGKKLGMSDEENYSKALSKINEREINLTKDTKSSEIFEQNRQIIDKVNQLERKFESNKLIGGELD